MVLNLRGFINLLILVVVVFLLTLQVNAHKKEEQNHNEERQAGIKPSGRLYQLAVIKPTPDFALVDLKGERVSLKDLQDKIKIISFIYTSCPDACPIVTGRLSNLREILKKEGLLGERVEI